MVRTRTKRTRPIDNLAGDVSDNPDHGWGIGWVDEFQRYAGEFKDRAPHGLGRSRTLISNQFPLGRSKGYEGEWRNGTAHGCGVGYSEKVCGFLPTGGPAVRTEKWYEGEWRHGQPSGNGVELRPWHT